MPDQPKAPNDLLRRARLRLPSPSGSGRAMSRQELAEAVNAWLFADTGHVFRLDETYIGKLERGEHRWPNERYRAALRAVLGATDAQLGFHTGRGSPVLIDAAAFGRAGGELLGGDTWGTASAAVLAALLLASSAYHGAKATATATTRALLLERVAWANARFGDAQAALRALGEVEDVYANTDPSADPAWVYWLNRDEIDVMAGRCLTQLRRPAGAIPLLAAAVDRYDDTHARELSLYLSWLAEAHLDAGHIDEAAHLAARCLTLSTGVTSARGTERVQLLRRLLVRHHGNGAVDASADQAAAVLGPPRTG